MKNLFFLLSMVLSLSVLAQDQQIVWQQHTGGSDYDVANALSMDSQGNFILSGYTLSNDYDVQNYHGSYYEDFFVAKINSAGSLIWAKCFGGTSQDIASDVFCIDTNIYVSGYTWSTDGDIPNKKGGEDFWLLSLDAHGNIMNNFVYGGSLSDENYCSLYTDLAIYLGGTSISSDSDFVNNSPIGYDAALIKIQHNGNRIWAKTYGGRATEHFYAIKKASPYVVCVGMSDSQDTSFVQGYGSSDALVSFINEETGSPIWEKRYGGTNYDKAKDICPLNDTSFIIVGYSASNDYYLPQNYGSYDAWIFAIGISGDTLWSKNYGGSKEDALNKVIPTKDNNFIAIGYTSSDDGDVHGHHSGNKDIWIIKFNDNGDTLWTKCLGSNVEDAGSGILETEKNHFIVSGYTQNANGDITGNYGLSDFWICEITKATTQLITEVKMPKVKIYPNPSNNIIFFKTDFSKAFTIEIYNSSGKMIKKAQSPNPSGKIDISHLKAGIYWIEFSSENKSITKKIIIPN